MININELNEKDFQSALKDLMGVNTKFIDILYNDEKNIIGIKYQNKEKINHLMIDNPDFILWLYKNNIDITSHLKYLVSDYFEIDEMNSILFEFVMEINRIIKLRAQNINILIEKYSDDDMLKNILEEIIIKQKELINKI